jgi:phosphoglycerate dehydrogenase-like enzyme
MSDGPIMVYQELPFDDVQWQRLKQAIAPRRLLVVSAKDDKAIGEALKEAEIAILNGDLDQRYIDAPKLKWVHCDHAGLTKSARRGVFERGLIVTSSAGRSGPALAEHAIMFMLMLCSNYPAFCEAQKRREWLRYKGAEKLRALWGRTIGIVGMGHTGPALAARCKAFEMRVLGYRRRDVAVPHVDRMFSADKGETLDPILDECDVLALVVNLSDATYHLIGEREIGRMKPGAIIVNLSRGSVIDEAALIRALREGRIAGAGLDVAETEPLPPSNPLWDAPNTLITPHFTAAMPDKSERSLAMILTNLAAYKAGKPLQNRITAEDLFRHEPVQHRLFRPVTTDILADDFERPSLQVGHFGRHVWRDQRVGCIPDRRVGRQGLNLEDVEAGARDGAVAQRCHQGGFVDHGPAGHVDQDGGALHQAKFARPDQVVRGVGQPDAEHHEVALPEQVVDALVAVAAVEPVDAGGSCGRVLAVREHAHA